MLKLISAFILIYLTTANSWATDVFRFSNDFTIKREIFKRKFEESGRIVDRDKYVLVDKESNPVTGLDIRMADLYEDYIYGSGFRRQTICYEGCFSSESYFVYKEGSKKPKYFYETVDFNNYLKKIGLPLWGEKFFAFDSYYDQEKLFRQNCEKHKESRKRSSKLLNAKQSIELPNDLHIRHVEDYCISGRYTLTNESLTHVIEGNLEYADWYGDYVYGRISNFDGPERDPRIRIVFFLYRKGNNKAQFFKNSKLLNDYITQIGLPEFDRNTSMFKSWEFQRHHRKYINIK